jgi:hypothetical protein
MKMILVKCLIISMPHIYGFLEFYQKENTGKKPLDD